MNTLLLKRILAFLKNIGIETIERPIAGECFLPGISIEEGKIIIDTGKLLYPGDILHEAGHVATASPDVRNTMSDALPDIDIHRSGEMMALAWSYAACIYIGLPPNIVFHADGYKGESESILNNFANGKYLALPMLQYCGMAYDKKKAEELNILPYPHMVSWLRQT